MPRFAGDFSGPCARCQEPVEFALGIRTDGEPIAMFFGPGGPTAVDVSDVRLSRMLDDELDVRLTFVCPLCRGSSAARVTCRAAPEPPGLNADESE